jgi:hypothetical protein
MVPTRRCATPSFINEFYNFQSEVRRWPQMVALVESLGFRCVDMIEPIWRADGVLWQMVFHPDRQAGILPHQFHLDIGAEQQSAGSDFMRY